MTRPETPGHTAIIQDDLRWVACTDMVVQLFGSDAPRWLHLADDPRATCVKTGHHRSIWRVTLADGDVFAKVFTGRGPLDQFKAWCGLTNGQREWHHAVAARNKGAAVASPLAVGVKRSPPVSAVYLCRGFDRGIPLPEAWFAASKAAQPGQTRRSLIESVAVLYATAHQAGLNHLDGHPHNVLVRNHDSDGFDSIFIDLAWARIRARPLDTTESAASLAQLDHFFRRVATKTERLRFLHRYHKTRFTNDLDLSARDHIRSLSEKIESARKHHAGRLAGRRDRRLHQHGKYFATIHFGNGWSGVFTLKHTRRHFFDLSHIEDRTEADWRSIMATITAGVFSKSEETGPLKEDMTSKEDGGLVVTVDRAAGLTQRIAWTLFGSPSRNVFLESHRCRHRDLVAPLILGFAQRRRGSLIDLSVTIRPKPQPDVRSPGMTQEWLKDDQH